MAAENNAVQRITAQHVKTMVEALNMVQDANVSPMAKDYEWYSQGAPRMYTLTRGGKVVIQGMRVADFYFACNAIAQTMIDVITYINHDLTPRFHATRDTYAK